jgi:hypothetical protein
MLFTHCQPDTPTDWMWCRHPAGLSLQALSTLVEVNNALIPVLADPAVERGCVTVSDQPMRALAAEACGVCVSTRVWLHVCGCTRVVRRVWLAARLWLLLVAWSVGSLASCSTSRAAADVGAPIVVDSGSESPPRDEARCTMEPVFVEHAGGVYGGNSHVAEINCNVCNIRGLRGALFRP